jgi:hypothetical protein
MMTAAAVIVSDAVFIILASKPFGSGFGSHLLLVIPRAVLTVAFAGVLLTMSEWLGRLRPGRSQIS